MKPVGLVCFCPLVLTKAAFALSRQESEPMGRADEPGRNGPDLDDELRWFVEGYGRVVRPAPCSLRDLPSGRGNHLSRGHRSVQQIRIAIEDLGLFRERLTGQGGLPFPRVYAAGNTLTFTHRETHYQIENLVG